MLKKLLKLGKKHWQYSLSVLLIAIIIVSGIIYLLRQPEAVAAEWWNDTWLYRQAITVTNSGSAQTDFGVMVIMDSATLVTASKMQSDCDDLRFTDINGDVLDYLLEASCNASNTLVWVEMPSIPAGVSTVYVYYGNTSAASNDNYIPVTTGVNIGDGIDGAITVAANKNINTDTMIAARSCADGGDAVMYATTQDLAAGVSQIILSSTPASGCLAVGDEMMIINSGGTSSDYANVGQYETFRITAINTATLTLNHNLANSYNGTTQKIAIQRVPNYTNVTVNSGYSISASTWDGTNGGVLAFRANGTVSIASTGSIDVSYDGYRGNDRQADNTHGIQGEGVSGTGAVTTTANNNGGGGGQFPYASGGGGAYGTAGTDGMQESGTKGTGGSVIGNAELTTLFFGGAGGRGGDNDSSAAHTPSGDGGGVAFVAANVITVTGNIYSKGRNGYAAYSQDGGDGGGGGGSIYLRGGSIAIDGTVVASGGTGTVQPSGNPGPLNGGAGGAGRIAIEYNTSLSGSTTPTSNDTQVPYAGSPSTEEQSTGPFSYWKFDEGVDNTCTGGTNDVCDSASGGNDGAITGATWQTEDLCISGKCLNFDGVDDYVGVAHTAIINSSLQGGLSLSAWIKPKTAGESNYGRIFSKATDTNGTAGFYLRLDSTSQRLAARVNASSTIYSATDSIVHGNGSWYHVAVTINSSGSVTFYVNGEQSGTPASTSALSGITTTTDLRIGNASSGTANTFDGFIDEPKIYNYVRTAAQIKAGYLAGLSGSSEGVSASLGGNTQNQSEGLVGYWSMDETSWDGTASEVVDSSGNGNHGTSYGSMTTTGTAKFGMAGDFDKIDDYINVADDNTLDLTNELTFAAWVNIGTPGNYSVVNKFSGGYSGYRYGIISGYLKLEYGNSSGGLEDANKSGLTFNSGYNHIAVTKKDTLVTHYLNGKSVYQTNITDPVIATNSTALHIGRNSWNSEWYDGQIDEVRVYNRALSGKEVRDLYKWAPGPISHYRFNKKSGTTIYDLSANGYNLSMTYMDGNTDWVRGKYGTGVDFDNTNDNATASFPDISSAYTISTWAKLDNTGSAYFVSFSSNIRLSQFNSNKFDCAMDVASSWSSLSSNIAIPINEWHYLTCSFDGANRYIYYDGILKNSEAFSDDTSNSAIKLGWGDSSAAIGGVLDDVKIYNYARTPEQILQDMYGDDDIHPVSYWNFDEGYGDTANDQGTGSNNGDLYGACPGAATCPTWSNSGKYNKALSFDGGDYISINDASLDINSNYTISAWFRFSSSSAGHGIVEWGEEATGKRRGMILWNGGSGSNYYLYSSTYSSNIGGSTALSADTWYHGVVTVDSSGAANVYLNGNLDGEGTNTLNTYTYGGTNIGRTAYPEYWNGLIDEVKVYNFVLSEDQVRQEYNQGSQTVLSSSRNSSSTWDDGGFGGVAPIGVWPMNEKTGSSAYDTSGNNNVGAISNATWSSSNKCKVGSCLSFDGTGDLVTVTDNSTIQFGTGDFTIEGWVNFNDIKIQSVIGNKDNVGTATETGYSIFTEATGNIKMRIPDGATNRDITGPTLDQTNTWYHFAVYRSGSSGAFFVDGIDQTSAVGSMGTSVSNSKDLRFGYDVTAGRSLDGYLDEVRIYDYARSTAQIAFDYNGGKPVGYWPLDDGEGITALDISGKGNAGTLTTMDPPNDWLSGTNCKYQGCLDFDGTSDYITMGDVDILGGSKYATWTAWVNPIGAGESTWQSIMTTWNDPDNSWVFDLRYLGVAVHIKTVEGGASSNYCYNGQNGCSDFITYGEWTHVAATLDNGTLIIYADGIEQASIAIGGNTIVTKGAGENLLIGGDRDGSVANFNGKLDDVRIYNYSLTAAQVKQVMNQGSMNFK